MSCGLECHICTFGFIELSCDFQGRKRVQDEDVGRSLGEGVRRFVASRDFRERRGNLQVTVEVCLNLCRVRVMELNGSEGFGRTVATGRL